MTGLWAASHTTERCRSVALGVMAVAADRISYEDLYERWEKSNWRAMEYDFARDREDWHEKFSDIQRRAALWNYALFFHGEDSVTDNLSPFIDAAPREEQKYFLATQQVDEARHAVFFKRFMHEVVELGDGTVAGGLAATRDELTHGFVKTFEQLDRVVDELRRDRSRTKLAQAVTMYHVIVEATLAQPGPALHRGVPRADRCAAGVPGGDAQRVAGRAAAHRLRGQAAAGPRFRGSRGARGGRRPAAPGAPVHDRRVQAAGLGPPLLGVLRVHAGRDLRGGREVVRVEAAGGRSAGRGPAGAAALPDRPAPARARAARDGAAAGGDPGREERAAGA